MTTIQRLGLFMIVLIGAGISSLSAEQACGYTALIEIPWEVTVAIGFSMFAFIPPWGGTK
jgi:hypothetical protein